MKKALFACMALAAAFAATSCQNDEELLQKELPQEPTNGPMVITGKATATINGKTIDVNWVQLWENGPKFAEYNVGATSVTDYGGGLYSRGPFAGKSDKGDNKGTFTKGSICQFQFRQSMGRWPLSRRLVL